jgi:hypothetical protein
VHCVHFAASYYRGCVVQLAATSLTYFIYYAVNELATALDIRIFDTTKQRNEAARLKAAQAAKRAT